MTSRQKTNWKKEAKEMHRKGNKLFISIDGVFRYVCDFSHAIDEGEALTIDYSHEDQANMVGYTKDILSKPHYVPSEVKGILDKVIDTQTLLAKNIESHLSVVNEIKVLIPEVTRLIKKWEKKFK